eukprot:1414781-Pyramimonas_sp.AAC.1
MSAQLASGFGQLVPHAAADDVVLDGVLAVGEGAPEVAGALDWGHVRPVRGCPCSRKHLQRAPQPGRRKGRQVGAQAHPSIR